MSDPGGERPRDDALAGLNLGGEAGSEMEVETPRRAASLTLRDEEESDRRAASLEAAQRSLSDALRITYRLMQVLIVALVVLFLFSGFRQVGENQSAVKTRFGAVVERDIQPGFTIALPFPLGEVRTVSSADTTLVVDEAFFPDLTDSERRRDFPATGSGDASFNPVRAGSLVTGDRNLAHARWSVTYRRADAEEYLRHLQPEDEEALVRHAVQAAAVRVAAEVPIEAIVGSSLAGLSAGEREGGGVASAATLGIEDIQRRVRELSQQRLDAIDSGLLISSVIALDPYPPRRVIEAFRNVDRALSQSRQLVEEADREASAALVQAAGRDFEVFLDLIDIYDERLAGGDEAGADAVLDAIHAAMRGANEDVPLTIDGQDFGTIAAGGEAAGEIRRAESFVTTLLRRAESDHRGFLVKLEQWSDSPEAFFARERSDALSALFNSDAVTLRPFLTPELDEFELLLNPDPEVQRRQERDRNRRERLEAIERREAEVFGDRD